MRLTYKTDNGEYTGMPNHIPVRQALEKLSKLEDIEDELGIDLITYFKIKKAKSVFVKELGHSASEMLIRNSRDNIDVCYEGLVNIPECDSSLYFKDYGKTWALTKEELE